MGLTAAGLILTAPIPVLIMLFTADSTTVIELTCHYGPYESNFKESGSRILHLVPRKRYPIL